ncbi:MAG: prepilin-type N-terminal cleavage/methylation domain-containing protein [Candidatus Competibacteraceae bacterium]|jgi:general secretion pathway protein J|nr:prepilin-type N-terminal cleavage/methylation domain-containing protein [Candidatus Competibacteraceae bacterium]
MRRSNGFTLLELLIAMSLMGIVLVMVYGGLRFGMRSWESGEQHAVRLNDIQLAQDFIRRQLRQSVSVFRNDQQEGRRVIVFDGDTQSLGIVTPMLEYLGQGGLYVMRIDRVEAEGVGHLRLRWHPYRPNEEDEREKEAQETIILDDVSRIEWAYYGFEQDAQEPSWFDRWDNDQQRPLLVRLSWAMQDQVWPDLLVPLTD